MVEKSLKNRIPYWDNLKLLLIFFVVLGHMLITSHNTGLIILSLRNYIYLFHMPAFIFVYGYFSKSYIQSFETTGCLKINKIFGYACLYFVFNILIWVENNFVSGLSLLKLDLLHIEGAPWYLMAMLIWLLILPVFAQMGSKVALMVAFFIGIFVPALGELSNLFSLGRVINFLPFFIMGYCFQSDWIDLIKRRKLSFIFSALVLTIVFILVINNGDFINANSKFLWESEGYDAYSMRKIYCIIGKCVYYLLASLLTLSLMILCPKKELPVTFIGSRTLGIYIGHILVRNILVNMGVFNYFDKSELTMLTFCIVLSIIFLVLFSGKLVNRIVNLPFKIWEKVI